MENEIPNGKKKNSITEPILPGRGNGERRNSPEKEPSQAYAFYNLQEKKYGIVEGRREMLTCGGRDLAHKKNWQKHLSAAEEPEEKGIQEKVEGRQQSQKGGWQKM